MDTSIINEGTTKLFEKLEFWGVTIVKMLPNIVAAFVILFVFWTLSSFVYKWSKKLLVKTHLNESLEHLVANSAKIATVILGFILSLSVVELHKTVISMLAGVGVIGLALGFAFKDLAANFMSGLMLAISTPIEIGDVIKISGIQGTVVDIRLRDTIIRNFDGQNVYIPNKEFTENELINYSQFGRRKVTVEVGIGYEDDPAEGVKIVNETLLNVDGVLSDPAPACFVKSLGDSSVNLFAEVWFTYPGGSFYQVRHDVTIAVKNALEDAGFSIPFPMRTLEINQDSIAKVAELNTKFNTDPAYS